MDENVMVTTLVIESGPAPVDGAMAALDGRVTRWHPMRH